MLRHADLMRIHVDRFYDRDKIITAFQNYKATKSKAKVVESEADSESSDEEEASSASSDEAPKAKHKSSGGRRLGRRGARRRRRRPNRRRRRAMSRRRRRHWTRRRARLGGRTRRRSGRGSRSSTRPCLTRLGSCPSAGPSDAMRAGAASLLLDDAHSRAPELGSPPRRPFRCWQQQERRAPELGSPPWRPFRCWQQQQQHPSHAVYLGRAAARG